MGRELRPTHRFLRRLSGRLCSSVAVTGPYAFLKTAGPARLGLTDQGLTFATNSRAGVCVEFHERITGIDPAGLIKHPNLTLTPADVPGVAAALE